jgi:hypothetical protein
VNRTVIEDGSTDRICPQASPGWENYATTFLLDYLAGLPIVQPQIPPFTPLPQDPRTTEDCLFLDVVVPKKILDGAKQGKKAPVLGLWNRRYSVFQNEFLLTSHCSLDLRRRLHGGLKRGQR